MTVALAERLRLDPARTAGEIVAALRRQVSEELGRSGLVVALSGGVDSAVCAGLAAAAVGARRVLGLALPERESEPRSLELARDWAAQLGIELVAEDITVILEACGCYARRDAVMARLGMSGRGWRCKLVVEGGAPDSDRLALSYLVAQSPAGEVRKVRLPAREVREIVAATSFKQRVRALLAYHHADRLRYAVVGTPNRLEYDLGFFVKGGDGLADVKPIAHLYKSQVYQLAEYLGVPAAIRERAPTTDTYPLPQTQEEFYFSLPLGDLDRLLEARREGRSPAAVAADLGMTVEYAERAYREIDRKRRASGYLHRAALLIDAAEGG